MRPPYSFRNHTDIGGQFSFPAHADGNRRYPAQDGLAFWKAGLARPRPAGLPARRADMRPRAGVGGAWRAFRSAARCGAPAPVTADQVGNADAYVPHPWFLRVAVRCRRVSAVSAGARSQAGRVPRCTGRASAGAWQRRCTGTRRGC